MDKEKRGHRVFCSNRKRRKGCGRSFAILRSDTFRHLMISTVTVSIFLTNIAKGMNIINAFKNSGSDMREATIYRIFSRFKEGQSRIRTLLTNIKDPPVLGHCNNAVIQTIAHLESAFPQSRCPVSEFQYCFQTTFF